jgi:hypothetical protein
MRRSDYLTVRTTSTPVCFFKYIVVLSNTNAIVTVFNAGFVEAASDQTTFEITGDSLDNIDTTSEHTAFGTHPEDSDEEDEAYDPGEADGDLPNSDAEPEDVFVIPHDLPEQVSVESVEPVDGDHDGEGEDRKSRNVRQKLAHPSSPRARNAQIIPRGPTLVEREVSGPPKLRVVVKDVAYATYRAVLYYVFPFFCPPSAFLDPILSSCIRTVSVSHHCPRPSSHRLRPRRAARKQQTIAKVALVPSPVQGRQKYLRVPARGKNGFKIGCAKIPGISIHAPQRPCTDLQTVSKAFVLSLDLKVKACGRAWACGTKGSGL